MKIVLFVFLLVIGAAFLFVFFGSPKPLQGLLLMSDGQSALARRARPKIVLWPQGQFVLERAGYKQIRPQDDLLENASARVSLALFQGIQKEAYVITALAECEDSLEWEAAAHLPYKALRVHEEPLGKETLYESLYLLPAKRNPFAEEDRLVARMKLLLFFRKMQVVCEYHEPVSKEMAHTLSLDLDPRYLAEFEKRATSACRILVGEEGEGELEKIGPMEGNLSRTRLSQWLGKVEHAGRRR